MPRRIAPFEDRLAAEILLGGQGVVRGAAEREIVRVMLAIATERLEVMQLEPVHFTAAAPRFVDERAP